MRAPFETTLQTFAQYIEKIGYAKGTRRFLEDHTEEFLLDMERKGIPSLERLQPEHIKEHYSHLEQRPNKNTGGGLSSVSLGHHVYAIRTFFNYLEAAGKLKTNPMSGLVFPSPHHGERTILTEQEIQKLYHAAENLRDKAILGVYYGCGLRAEEGEKLSIRDVHFRQQLLYVREGKKKKRRVIPLSGRVAEDLKNYYYHERAYYAERSSFDLRGKSADTDKEAFFLNNAGTRMRKDNMRRRLCKMKEKNPGLAGKEVSLHSLRHSISTHLLERGLDLEYIKEFLGHTYLYTTQRYTRISQEQIKKVLLGEKQITSIR
jgi:integrase/recombinase XerD